MISCDRITRTILSYKADDRRFFPGRYVVISCCNNWSMALNRKYKLKYGIGCAVYYIQVMEIKKVVFYCCLRGLIKCRLLKEGWLLKKGDEWSIMNCAVKACQLNLNKYFIRFICAQYCMLLLICDFWTPFVMNETLVKKQKFVKCHCLSEMWRALLVRDSCEQ